MKTSLRKITLGMIRSASCATRCRAAAMEAGCDPETRAALLRAADRYSGQIRDLAAELVDEAQ